MTALFERRAAPASSRPVLLELVGPAGAGKTTLAGALPRDPELSRDLDLWGLPLRHLIASAVALLPTTLASVLARRPLRRPEMEQMIRIGALRRAIRGGAARERRVVLMDEGPVFGLAWLEVFYGRNGDTGWARWRRRTLAQWGELLDGVIRLDASDEVLAQRIRGRIKPHLVKHRSNGEITRFSARFRAAFDRVLKDLEAAGGVTVRHVRTDGESPDEAARQLTAAIEEIRRGN